MACSNCFNGCTETISDQCVKYTGSDIPALDISNGNTLNDVEFKITKFIVDLSTGDRIIPTIDPADICPLVSSFLSVCNEITLNDVISTLLKSICALKDNVDAIDETLDILNADYTVGCLSDVTASSDTHDVLQAAINKLCSTATELTALELNVLTNYVKLADLNNLIQAYIDSTSSASLQKNKMVPYVAYEYYGSLEGFDVTGAGCGDFEDVYLCNGGNGTPDKRGRVAVGTTDGSMAGSIPMNSTVNPSTPGNPIYSLNSLEGLNNITLSINQIPSHTHTATATSSSVPHSHLIARPANGQSNLTASGTLATETTVGLAKEYRLKETNGTASVGLTSSSTVSVSTSVLVDNIGGGLPHSNVQPSIGAYYIMYIP